MENTTLAHLIDEVQEMMNSLEDISNRVHDPKGTIAKLEAVGLQSTYLKRDLIVASTHLALYLKIARQTLDLWIQAKNTAKKNESGS